MDEVYKRISGFYTQKKSNENFYESKYCIFQLKQYDHDKTDSDKRDQNGGKIISEIQYDMSRYLNPFEAIEEKEVNGVVIKNNFVPIYQ